MSRPIFFILGMHRSGTLLLAQTLGHLGLEYPVSIQSGSPDNPQGNFELFNITHYHDCLLKAMGLSWDTFTPPPESWFSSDTFDVAIRDLSTVIRSKFPGNGPIVLKDPRLSLFLPLWKKIARKADLEDLYIFTFRHPFDVAASLSKCTRISRSRSLLIWLNYMFKGEKDCRGERRTFIDFPRWTQELEASIDKIRSDLNTEVPDNNDANLSQAKSMFDQNLVHHTNSQITGTQCVIENLCFETYLGFIKLTQDASDASALSMIDEQRSKFELLSAAFFEVSDDLSRNEIDALSANADSLRNELEQATATIDVLQQKLQMKKTRTSTLRKNVSELENQNRLLAAEHERLLINYHKEQFTVLRPIYRNIYKRAGLLLRNTLPSTWVESIRTLAPNPNGVPKYLSYRPHIAKHINVSFDQFDLPAVDAKPDIFVLSIIDWDFRFQRPQHIAKGLADSGRRVFYVEMELADKAPQITKISDNLYCARLSSQSVGFIQPYKGKPDALTTVRWVSAFYVLCDAVRATSFKQIIVQHPFWWQLARHLPPEFQVIFDCMDDTSGFANTEQFILDLEQDLLAKCDRLVVSSQYLANKYENIQMPVLIRNAAELSHFDKGANEYSPPPFLRNHLDNAKPDTIKVGYVGAIADWFDADLVKNIALSESDLEFHLCGAVTAKEPAKLAVIDNIFMHGEIPYSEVPGFLQAMDVLIIPFKIVPIIQACDPVKFYEYSAMGKPTVTTTLPELSRVSDLVFLASSASEFARRIREACEKVKTKQFRTQLQEYAARNTWTHRTDQFVDVLDNAPKVSIVILSYGDPDLTKATLHSLYDGGPTYPQMEVLVVDNGSPPDLLEGLKQSAGNYPNVRLIENSENLGFAKGNNVGLTAASGEYVMLLNNDTVVAPGAIYAMVRHLENNPTIGAVGPLTNNIGNEAKLFVEYEDIEQMKSIARQATIGYRGVVTPIKVVAYFAVMLRRADLDIFGLLSEDYGRGMFEDDDHCTIIKSKGYTCALAEDAYIHHHLSATFSTLKDGEKAALFESNKKMYERKWGPWKPHKYREERPKSSLMSQS